MTIELTDEQKCQFALGYHRSKEDSFRIVANLLPKKLVDDNPLAVINIAWALPNDPVVIEELDRLSKTMPTEAEVLHAIWTKANDPLTDRKYYAAIMKVYADIRWRKEAETSDKSNYDRIKEIANAVVPGICP